MSAVRLVAYVRVSSNAQVQLGQGREIQEEDCRRWARQRKHRIVEVCVDSARSGGDDVAHRPGLERALALLGAGRADGIVVQVLDRLARDMILQEQLLAELQRVGKELHSTSAVEDYNLEHTPDDPARALVRRMFGAIAQYERDKIRLRLRAGRARKALEGGYVGGAPPFGFAAVRGDLVPIPDEQKALKLMRRLRGEGKSYRAICDELHRRGIPSRAPSGTWLPGTLHGILTRVESRNQQTRAIAPTSEIVEVSA